MKAKKGQIVFISGQWNDFNIGYVEEVEVHSWGKKQATASHVHSGQMLRSNIRLKDGDNAETFATYAEAEAHSLAILNAGVAHAEAKHIDRVRHSEIWAEKTSGPYRANHISGGKRYQAELDDYEANGVYVLTYEEALKRLGAA